MAIATLVPFFGSLFMFILVANFFGLIPGMEPPTGDSDLTFALGTICFGFYIYQGFAPTASGTCAVSLDRYLLLAPLMLPIELADNLFRPVFARRSSLRQHVRRPHRCLSIFTGLTKLVVPLAFYALGAIVCVIQALIFMVLTMSYVELAAEPRSLISGNSTEKCFAPRIPLENSVVVEDERGGRRRHAAGANQRRSEDGSKVWNGH